MAPRLYTARISASARRHMQSLRRQGLLLSQIFARSIGGGASEMQFCSVLKEALVREESVVDQEESSSDDVIHSLEV